MRSNTEDAEYDDDGEVEDDPRLPAVLKRYFRRRLLILAWLIPAWTAVMMLPTRMWAIELTRHFVVYWLLAALISGIVAACCRRWVRTGLCAAAFLAHGAMIAPYFLPPPDRDLPAAEDRSSFTLVSANLLVVVRDPETTLRSLLEADPDVLLLLEFSPEWARHLQPLLDRYPVIHRRAQDDPYGILLASRLPVEMPEFVELASPRVPAIAANLKVGTRQVRFAGIHLANPIQAGGSELIGEQLGLTAEMLAEENLPDRVLAGDFNAAPWSLTFRDLAAATGLRDTALGRGIRNTWSPVRWPVLGLPLDHVLVSGRILVLDRQEGPPTGSDHRWVKVRLGFADGP